MASLSDLLNHSDSDESVISSGPPLGSGSESSGLESRLSLGHTSSYSSIASSSTPTSATNSATNSARNSAPISASSSTSNSAPGSVTTTTPPGEIYAELFGKKLPRSKVDKRFFPKERLVKIAVRRKSSRKSSTEPVGSKLHLKSLEAALRVKLTLVPSLTALYCSLTPNTNRQPIRSLYEPSMKDGSISTPSYNYDIDQESTTKVKLVQLIDSDLVNLSGVSNKILLGFNGKTNTNANEFSTPTFNSLDTAIYSLFGANNYTLVRVTRSATDEADGSLVLKLETAQPGDYLLIDDEDFADDMLHSIGKPGRRPNNLFIKKIVARPRYKSGMKIYFVPYSSNASLYVDDRMLKRDLFKGVLDLDLPLQKHIATAFEYSKYVEEYKNAVDKTRYSSVPMSMLVPGPNGDSDQLAKTELKLNR